MPDHPAAALPLVVPCFDCGAVLIHRHTPIHLRGQRSFCDERCADRYDSRPANGRSES